MVFVGGVVVVVTHVYIDHTAGGIEEHFCVCAAISSIQG
jgi:hypothetical protein